MTENAEDFLRMYRSLTDPEEQDKARRASERTARMAARRADTGL